MKHTLNVVKNGPREYCRESRTSDRVYVGMVTTWDIVEVETCEARAEYRTRKEALTGRDRMIAANPKVYVKGEVLR